MTIPCGRFEFTVIWREFAMWNYGRMYWDARIRYYVNIGWIGLEICH